MVSTARARRIREQDAVTFVVKANSFAAAKRYLRAAQDLDGVAELYATGLWVSSAGEDLDLSTPTEVGEIKTHWLQLFLDGKSVMAKMASGKVRPVQMPQIEVRIQIPTK